MHEPTVKPNETLAYLREAREAYAHHAWYEAYHAFLSADEEAALQSDDLERLATASYMIGRELEFQRFIERLHRIHLETDRSEGAARCAFWLALSFLNRGDMGQSNAWTTRGYELVQDRDCVERGYMLAVTATQQLYGDHAEPGRRRPRKPPRLANAAGTPI